MTESSIIAAPTLEQRALAISACCPAGWVVRPLGPSLAVFSPSDLRTPYSVMHGDDLQVLAAVWGWYAGVIELKASVASAAKHEAELAHLRDQLAEAHDYARREMVWVPGSVAAMSTSEQVAAAMREETGEDVEPRPHSRSNVLDEVRGLGEQTERFDRAATGASPVPPAKPRERFVSMLGHHGANRGPSNLLASLHQAPDSCGNPIRWTGVEWVPVEEPVQTVASEAYLGETTPRSVFEPGPVPARAAGWTGITWMSGKGRAKSLTLPGLRVITERGSELRMRAAPEAFTARTTRVFNKAWKLGRPLTFHLQGGLKRALVRAIATSDSLAAGAVAGDIFATLPKVEGKPEAPKPARQGIAWRRPGHDVDSFHEAPIRPTYDDIGNHVIEVHGEIPDDLQAEIRQAMRDRPTITATTGNGAGIVGPVTAWRRHRDLTNDTVTWFLTMPAGPRMKSLPT